MRAAILKTMTGYRKHLILLAALLLGLISLGQRSEAQSRLKEENLAFVGERVFDLLAKAKYANPGKEYLFVRRVDWLDELVNRDNLFFGIVFFVYQLKGDRIESILEQYYIQIPSIPKQFKVDGFDVKVRQPDNMGYIYRPIDNPEAMMASCSMESGKNGDRDKFGYCSLLVPYHDLVLQARMYAPEHSLEFQAIADRMIAVAKCLDVTEEYRAQQLADAKILKTPEVIDPPGTNRAENRKRQCETAEKLSSRQSDAPPPLNQPRQAG